MLDVVQGTIPILHGPIDGSVLDNLVVFDDFCNLSVPELRFRLAVSEKNIECINKLLPGLLDSPQIYWAIISSIWNGSLVILEALLQFTGTRWLNKLCLKDVPAMFLLLENYARSEETFTPLTLAIYLGRIDMVIKLLNVPGINPNQPSHSWSKTPLQYAVYYGGYLHTEDKTVIVRLLFAVPGFEINAVDGTGKTALHDMAAMLSTPSDFDEWCIPVLNCLLQHPDIDVNLKDFTGMTPLLLATSVEAPQIDGRETFIQCLLNYPTVNINARDPDGCSALFHEIYNTCSSVVTELLLGRPDFNIHQTDNRENTPLHAAVAYQRCYMVTPLLQLLGPAAGNTRNVHNETPLMMAFRHLRSNLSRSGAYNSFCKSPPPPALCLPT